MYCKAGVHKAVWHRYWKRQKVNGTQQRPEIDPTIRGNLEYDRDGAPSAGEMDYSVNSIGKMASHLENN